jgi:hypothetical protein
MGVITLGLATTLVLPGRQTAPVIDAFRKLITGTLGTAIGLQNGK